MNFNETLQEAFDKNANSIGTESVKLNLDHYEMNYIETKPKEPKKNYKRISMIRTNNMVIEELDNQEKEIQKKYYIPDKKLEN